MILLIPIGPNFTICAVPVRNGLKSTLLIGRSRPYVDRYEGSVLRADRLPLSLLIHAATLRAGGAMNSGPTGSLIVAARMRSTSALAGASRCQPLTSSTGSSWPGEAAPPRAVGTASSSNQRTARGDTRLLQR